MVYDIRFTILITDHQYLAAIHPVKIHSIFPVVCA